MAPSEDNPGKGSGQGSDLGLRVLSALVLAPVVLAIVYAGTPYFEILIIVAALVMAWEWRRVCYGANKGRLFWLLAGQVYILLPCLALLHFRALPMIGMQSIFWLLAVVWASDTGGYVFGRAIGGPKLAPVISPNKTWSGLLGAVLLAGAAGLLTALALGKDTVVPLAAWSAAIGAISQAGDLLESWVKRYFGVKDTGTIIPGHGGLLDRVDGLLAAAMAVALLEAAVKSSILLWT